MYSKKIFILLSFFIFNRTNSQCINPANLDTTFGSQRNGIVTFSFPGNADSEGDGGVTLDDQNRIVVVGTTGSVIMSDFDIARPLSNGTLRTNGPMSINFSSQSTGTGGVVHDQQGRIIIFDFY